MNLIIFYFIFVKATVKLKCGHVVHEQLETPKHQWNCSGNRTTDWLWWIHSYFYKICILFIVFPSNGPKATDAAVVTHRCNESTRYVLADGWLMAATRAIKLYWCNKQNEFGDWAGSTVCCTYIFRHQATTHFNHVYLCCPAGTQTTNLIKNKKNTKTLRPTTERTCLSSDSVEKNTPQRSIFTGRSRA